MRLKKPDSSGFSMIELVFSMMILGVVLIAFFGIFSLFQKSSAQSHQYAEAQQNSRIAVDFITDYLRQAGSGTDYVRGQRFIVHAAPYQVAFNADIDNSQTIGGYAPLAAISRAHSPNTVPASGTTIYTPRLDFQSPAETVVLTIDSSDDGVISGSDQGDDPEESGANTNLYVLRRVTYGFDGSSVNDVRPTNLALVRGPGAYSNGTHPQPLFQYFYDHDDDAQTPLLLFGDSSGDGKLSGAEIPGVTPMPDSLLARIRKVRITVVSESDNFNKKFKDTDGFLTVSMNSEVFVRNATRSNSVVYGYVYHDLNGDGVLDTDDIGIPNVTVKLVGTNREAVTNSYGVYYMPVSPGDYTIREEDPPGYISTTPNTVNADVSSGSAVQINFGDQTGSAVGIIRGTVFDDLDMDGVRTNGEAGLPDVLISLDTGEQVHTNAEGRYQFVMPVGGYVVVETDPDGYGSTTPNSADADIVAAGDTVTVNFGDTSTPLSGTIEGYVFEDNNMDGVRDAGESGLSNVTLFVSSGDSTTTNPSGFYQFSLSPGVYSIKERDEPGYTSSTVNTYLDILITPDTTVTRDFGDFLISQNDYIEITIGNTERALSVAGADLREDTKADLDIVLGTPFTGGSGNMLVFLNKRKNANTALGALFDSTPNYRRDAGHNINSLNAYDFSGDNRNDVLSGIQFNIGANIQIWHTGANGVLSTSPDDAYQSSGNTFVMDSKLAHLNNDDDVDLILGLKTSSGTFTGGIQTFKRLGSGEYAPLQYVTTAGANGEYPLGEIWAVDTGDVDGDGDDDIVVGSRTSDYVGYIDVYINLDNASGAFEWGSRYFGLGAVNDLQVIDMMEDDAGDPDLLVGSSSAPNSGWLMLWQNNGGVFGRPDSTEKEFPAGVIPNWPHDAVAPGAEILTVAAGLVNPDIFPEVFYGTRSSAFYAGDVYLVETYGMLPSTGRRLNTTGFIGEVVTMNIGDFNKDNWKDLVVGTRSSSTQGKLLIYFNDG
ncbi:MAG: hypothetical protein JSW58_09675 [Candidatus Latescibacterota bacterium]|nr:MAG: hypothetical protein JSW58_09675 [Candidatus Latescibacterota bacterium]